MYLVTTSGTLIEDDEEYIQIFREIKMDVKACDDCGEFNTKTKLVYVNIGYAYKSDPSGLNSEVDESRAFQMTVSATEPSANRAIGVVKTFCKNCAQDTMARTLGKIFNEVKD